MGRWKHAAAVLDAAEQWKRRCLLDGGSLLTAERLWTRACFEQLRTHFVERPDSGSDPFEDKLRRQLDPAPPAAKRLWAEMTWVYDLIVNNVRPVTKLDRIRTVWEQSGASLPEDHWALGEVLECGVANPGPDWHRWREFRFIITMMIAWFSLSDEERRSCLAGPWHFAEWLDGQEESRGRQFRHSVLFLLFPDYFERIVTTRHKRDVVKAFRGDHGEVSDVANVASMSLIDLDRELLGIRERLQAEHQDEDVDFYESPFKGVWWRSSDSTYPPKDDDNLDHELWYRGRFGEADVWAIAAGEGARLWPDFQEHGIAAIGFDKGGGLGDLSEYDSRETVHRALVENGYGQNPHVSALAAWEFSREMKIGDFLIAKTGRSVIVGWGKVTGGYSYEPERPEYRHTRAVEWHPLGTPISLLRKITPKTLTRFSPYRKTLRSIFAKVADKREPKEATPEAEPYDIALALGELFIDDGQFRRILDSIALRKNLILQGPPGVGKTFIARRIAWCLIGRKDPRPIEMVQFHQSYAYEDFVQGWRPNEHGGFTLRNGVFFDFCKRAAQEPGTPFVFIIDEINRGNLSRVFGELLLLVEPDKRGPDHAIRLTYGRDGERFSVPDNVRLLGLMNTADRSLAMVDYALRRRFAFETLKPAFGAKFREYLLEADVERALVDRIVRNMTALNDDIRKDKDLGPGFEIGHSYFVPDESADADEQWYRNVVDTQIAPLLREYWFDRPRHVDELIENLRQ